MDELKTAIHALLQSDDVIARERVSEWIREGRDVETLALLYRLTAEAWDRIEPRLQREETCLLIRRYLLQCIHEDPQESITLSRQEAAGELEGWFDHLADREDTHGILQEVVGAVTELYLSSNEEVRSAIETGFLEHVLEQTRLRFWFSHWARDERLHDVWQRALAWGEAHPDFMKGMREQLRQLQSPEE
jgi:hypothetical protein